MTHYPVNTISTPDGQVHILQITDLHLSLPLAVMRDQDSCDKSVSYRYNFEKVLEQALSDHSRCDLILVTGDLVNRVEPIIYDYVFEVLQATNIAFACIAGNHDVTDEVGCDLPFLQRKLIGRPTDARLLSQHVIETDHWQLLLLDSSITGKVAGEITPADLDWLCGQLSACHKPALIALHHHVMPVGSAWIDAQMVENSEVLWEHLAAFSHLKVMVSGHVHQEQVRYRHGVTLYSTPSTCYQFMPYQDDFAYDSTAQPGYRWLQLANNGEVASWVKRLDT